MDIAFAKGAAEHLLPQCTSWVNSNTNVDSPAQMSQAVWLFIFYYYFILFCFCVCLFLFCLFFVFVVWLLNVDLGQRQDNARSTEDVRNRYAKSKIIISSHYVKNTYPQTCLWLQQTARCFIKSMKDRAYLFFLRSEIYIGCSHVVC
jgi:hypothetical protein